MARRASDIPVGTQFSPELINLGEFLAAIVTHSGNRAALQAAIWAPPVHRKKSSVPASRRTANLPLEAAVQYGLLEPKTYVASELARHLSTLSGPALHEAFARHILQKCGGLRVVEGAGQMQLDQDMGLSDVEVTGDSLARYLSNQGFQVTEHNTAINSLRMWLAEAGLFPSRGWKVDAVAKKKLLGLADEAVAILVGFSDAQLAFVDALCRINPSGWCKASDVRGLAEATSGVHLGRSSLPKEALEPLERAGLIEYRSGGTRGGKAAVLRTTSAFDKDVLQPFVAKTVKTLDPTVTAYYKARPEDIYAGLDSTHKYVKGRALEAYAIHIMRLLGLRFVAWRKRANVTRGAEIDVILTGLFGGIPTLWQVQCKNTPSGRVDLEDVAKEVGLVPVTRATHVMIIANAPFTQDARVFAMQVMRSTPLTIFLLGNDEYGSIKKIPGSVGTILRTLAEQIIQNRAQGQSSWR